MLEPQEPQVPAQPAVMPTFDFTSSPNRQKRYWRSWHTSRLWGMRILQICWICWICRISVFLGNLGHTYAPERICRICKICIFSIFCIFYHRIRAPWISASLVCDSSVLHTGNAASCSSRQYWDDTIRDAKRSSRLSRSLLRQNKGQQRLLQVVVREQLGPQLGNKAIREWQFPKESVAELVGRQAFLCWKRGFESSAAASPCKTTRHTFLVISF